MPDAETLKRAKRDAEEGMAPSTQAGEFVREEIHHIRAGKHGARSAKQAIAIGLSKARRAGIDLDVPASGTVPENTRRQALRERAKTRRGSSAAISKGRSRGALKALKKEGRAAASPAALARHARAAARRHTPAQRGAAARKGTRTRARAGR
jgi:hypothetical protein